MIRALVIISIAGFIISVASCSIGIGLAGPDFARQFDVDWPSGKWADYGDVDEGEYTTDERAWDSDTTRIEIHFPAQLTYVQDEESTVVLSGPENLIAAIEINNGNFEMREGRRWRDFSGERDVHITVRGPGVSEFELNGAQQLEIRDFDQETLEIQSNGASDITASGRADRVDLNVNGAGRADLGAVRAREARVELNGAGTAMIQAIDDAVVQINGAGEVTLLGRPENVVRQINGFGQVRYDDVPDMDEETEEESAQTGDETAESP